MEAHPGERPRRVLICGRRCELSRRLAVRLARDGAVLADAGDRLDEVWHLVDERDRAGLARPVSAPVVHHVVSAHFPDEALAALLASWDERASQQRTFRHAPLLTEPAADGGGEPLGGLLAAIAELKKEITARRPDYFDHQALRCAADAERRVALLPVDVAVEWMVRLSQRARPPRGHFDLAPSGSVALGDLFEAIGRAHGLSLLAVSDRSRMNAVDHLLEARLPREALPVLTRSSALDGRPASAAAGLPWEQTEITAACLEANFAAWQEWHRAGQIAEAARVERVFESMERRSVSSAKGGGPLVYLAGGSGPPVILLSALGQGLRYWRRLIDRLLRHHRVVVWEPRGAPSLLADHVDDVEAVIRSERIERCHLVAWCTGPKVALNYCLRHSQQVASMAFVTGAFRPLADCQAHETTYERTLEPLCRILEIKPGSASSVMSAMRAAVAEGPPGGNDSAEPVAELTLRAMDRELREAVLQPYRDEIALVGYARQLMDFWSHDIGPQMGEVRAPVLIIGAEYDAIASPAISRAVARRLSRGRYVELQAATHHCMHDRPDLVAGLLERFFADPDSISDRDGEARLHAD